MKQSAHSLSGVQLQSQTLATSKAHEGSGNNKWVVFSVTAIGVFMATLDSSIVNISLPSIATSFGVPLNGAVSWVIIAYLIVMASALLTAGRLADMIGRKSVWSAGLLVFILGSAFCGAAPSLGLLIAARALQGVGGALMLSVSPAMITSAFPLRERGRALGFSQVNVAIAVSAGPTLGGFILATLSWHWIFYVNVPLGLICLLATRIFLHEPAVRARGRFDPYGASLLALGLAGIMVALSFGENLGWTSFPVLACLVIGALSLLAVVFVERRVASPIIDLSLLRHRVFSLALSSYMLAMMALFAVSFVLPFYLEQLRGFPAQLSGLLLTPLPLTMGCVAPFSGWLADRLGSRWLAVVGLGISCVGLVLLSQLDMQSTIWDIVWRLMVVGAGQACFQAPNSSTILSAAPRERQGIASGFLGTSRVIGQSTSVALAGAILSGSGAANAGLQLVLQRTGSAHMLVQPEVLQQTFLSGFHLALLVCACIAVPGILTSLVRGDERGVSHLSKSERDAA
ncbi:MFS transporter [Ktedonosporobacter rubrisoli]|nr:MFS transporter [Ktedonosporobacter rubrisoli]